MGDDGELIGGRYALGELIGVGGTGSVFAAVDHGAGGSGVPGASGAGASGADEVAVKLLHPHLCEDEASRAAFLREASHVMGLRHPNIVRVRDAGLHDAAGVTMPWIALDLLQGPTLREWVEATGRLAPTDAAAVVAGVLAGLGAAHRAGIVHRDISPQNVILHGVGDRSPGTPLTPDLVRIVDFGLADVTGRSTRGGDVLLAADRAETGVVGNAAFMSPEQAEGRPVRAVSDLYQVGAVLYYALTGRPPFPRESTAQVMQAHVTAPPPVPSVLATGARPFDRVVTRAMAKTPARRFRDADAFAAAVAEASALVRGAADAGTTGADLTGEGAAGGAGTVGDAGGAGAPVHGEDAETGSAHTSATRILAPQPLGYLSPALAPAPATSAAPVVPARGGIAAGVIGVLILALAGWAVAAATAQPGTTAPPAAPTPEISAIEPAAEPSAPSPAPTAATPPPAPVDTAVAAPTLYGTLADAEAALRAAGLALGTVTRIESSAPADRVLGQRPAAGEQIAAGTAVDVTIASGANVVPLVAGMSYASAVALIESAGFAAVADRTDAGPAATVTVTQPGAGAVLRVGVTVTLVLSAPSTPTPGPTAPTPPPPEDLP